MGWRFWDCHSLCMTLHHFLCCLPLDQRCQLYTICNPCWWDRKDKVKKHREEAWFWWFDGFALRENQVEAKGKTGSGEILLYSPIHGYHHAETLAQVGRLGAAIQLYKQRLKITVIAWWWRKRRLIWSWTVTTGRESEIWPYHHCVLTARSMILPTPSSWRRFSYGWHLVRKGCSSANAVRKKMWCSLEEMHRSNLNKRFQISDWIIGFELKFTSLEAAYSEVSNWWHDAGHLIWYRNDFGSSMNAEIRRELETRSV